MAIAITLQEYLDDSGIEYEVLPHTYTTTSMNTALASRISGNNLAKSVILGDEYGYLMAIVPATHHIEIGRLSNQLNRRLGLATEQELEDLFTDCDMGAIPPVGNLYGMNVIVDDALMDCNDVYFEAGDHTDLIHISGNNFSEMVSGAEHGQFSHHC